MFRKLRLDYIRNLLCTHVLRTRVSYIFIKITYYYFYHLSCVKKCTIWAVLILITMINSGELNWDNVGEYITVHNDSINIRTL